MTNRTAYMVRFRYERLFCGRLTIGLVAAAALALAGCGEGDDNHPYFDKAVKEFEDSPVVEVGDLARCQKVVGAWVFFKVHHEPFTAANRGIVDGVCRAASPSDRVEVVGDVALEEIRAGP